MPPLEEVSLNQTAVLWRAGPPDRYGTHQVYPPEEISVNWVERPGAAGGPQGGTDPVNGTVLVDVNIPLNSILWKGELADWTPQSGSLMTVVGFNSNWDIKGRFLAQQVLIKRYNGTLPTVINE